MTALIYKHELLLFQFYFGDKNYTCSNLEYYLALDFFLKNNNYKYFLAVRFDIMQNISKR